MILQLPFAVSIPEEGSVFDYYLDLKKYAFLPWSERHREGGTSGGSGYIVLPEVSSFPLLISVYCLNIKH